MVSSIRGQSVPVVPTVSSGSLVYTCRWWGYYVHWSVLFSAQEGRRVGAHRCCADGRADRTIGVVMGRAGQAKSERHTGEVWALIQAWMDAIPYPPSQA